MNRSRDHLISRYFVKDYKMLSKTCEFCVKFSHTDDFKSLQEGQYHEKDFSA